MLYCPETILAQEAERKRIARELHDHIGQSVYSIFLGLEVIKQSIDDDAYQSHISNMVNVMEKTLEKISKLSKSLRSEMLYHVGLKESLREAIRDWMKLYQVDIDLEMDIDNDKDFDREKEMNLFRIIQEAVRNAVRHGNATTLTINLRSKSQHVYFTLEDNGTGFDVGKSYKGLGLRHIVERSHILSGDITWNSREGGPTKIEGVVSLIKDGGEISNELNDCR